MARRTTATTGAPTPTQLSTGEWTLGPTATITCCDCQAERVIKIQDVFQVKRCPDCQKAHQRAHAKEKRQAKAEANREAKDLARAKELLAKLGIDLPEALQG